MNALTASSRATLGRHARSFSLASRFLDADRADAAARLYALCRALDDLVDEASDEDAAAAALAGVRAELTGELPAGPLVAAVLADGVPAEALVALADGVGLDLHHRPFAHDAELLRYAYGVAGTVGLAMCGVLGVRDRSAWPHAVDLGIAMQLTNICRDVAEDAARGRVYLPARRLRAAGTSPEALLEGAADRQAVAAVVRDLLVLAERYYDSGLAGLPAIPWGGRLAIGVAASLYRAIGRTLLARGGDALAGRTVTGLTTRALAVVQGVGAVLGRSVGRVGRHDLVLHRDLDGLPGCHPAP